MRKQRRERIWRDRLRQIVSETRLDGP